MNKFDPHYIEHVAAWRHLCEKGFWPEDFELRENPMAVMLAQGAMTEAWAFYGKEVVDLAGEFVCAIKLADRMQGVGYRTAEENELLTRLEHVLKNRKGTGEPDPNAEDH